MNLNYLFNLVEKAYKLGMYGADYAWILQETFERTRWWESAESTDCSLKHLHSAVEKVLIVSSYNNIVGEETSISGLVGGMETKFELAECSLTAASEAKTVEQTQKRKFPLCRRIRSSSENSRP
jgi:hypothetical protein